MNRIFYAFIALMALASCANSYDISGTSNVSTLDGRMLYLKILENNDFKNVDSCDVVHGQFHFQGSVDSMKMANIFMDGICLVYGRIAAVVLVVVAIDRECI